MNKSSDLRTYCMYETSGEIEQFSRCPNLLFRGSLENKEDGDLGQTNADARKRNKASESVNPARTYPTYLRSDKLISRRTGGGSGAVAPPQFGQIRHLFGQ